MNKERRKKLQEAQYLLSNVMNIVMEVQSEEAEAFENLPESLQESERGEQMHEYMDALEEAKDSLEEVWDSIDEISCG